MALLTRKSNPNKPPIVMIYGREGTGKSTFGARAPKPVFVSPEGGSDRLATAEGAPVDEMPNVNSWSSARGAIKSIAKEDHDFKTLVLDSADWLEKLCHADIIGTSGKSITTVNGGYGAGYRQAEQMHRELIADLSEIREKRNMNIVVCAHAHVKQAKDPEMLHDYDTYEIKCHELVSALWREWVEGLFFVRFKTFTKTSDDTEKARALGTDERVVYTVQRPAFQAKNRFGMPAEMEFTLNYWNDFMQYAAKGAQPESPDEILREIQSLHQKVKEEATAKAVAETILKAGRNPIQLGQIRSRLKEITA